MWIDDYHDHYVRCENLEELEEFCEPLFIHKKNDKRWKRMRSNVLKCAEIFGYLNISLFSNDDMKYGNGIEEFLSGFWVNLKDADFNEGYLEIEETTITIENGFMFIR